jgi:hypothetical protein
MKKIVSILAFLAIATVADAQKVITYPFGAAQSFTAAASGTTAVTANNQMVVMSAAPTLTAAATISVTAGSNLKAGAILLVAVKTTSTEVTTFAGAVVSPTVAGVAGKTWTQGFIYNGSYFYPMGTKQQVD